VRLSLHPDFALDARASSQLGSRAKLVDVPKLEQILVERLRAAVHARLVWPRFVSLSLPDLVASALLPRVVEAAVTAAATASPPTPGAQGETREQMLGRQASARAAGALGPGGGLFFEHPHAAHAHARETGSSVSGSAFPPSASVAGGPSAARPGFARAPSSHLRSMPLQHEPQHIPAVEAWRNHASAATGVELRAGADARQRNAR
jgi:maintenance of morphology protein 1